VMIGLHYRFEVVILGLASGAFIIAEFHQVIGTVRAAGHLAAFGNKEILVQLGRRCYDGRWAFPRPLYYRIDSKPYQYKSNKKYSKKELNLSRFHKASPGAAGGAINR